MKARRMMSLETALLDVSRMSEVDRLTVAAGTPAIDLMENAGKSVGLEIVKRWSARPVIVLCGPGNNGGDGFVTASYLAKAAWPVRVALLGSPDHLTKEARHYAERWFGSIETLAPGVLDGAELVVDALFGAGLSRRLEGVPAETLAAAALARLPVVAIDVPSGLMGDTGEVLGAVAAVLTVTFFRKKPGHLLLPGRLLCGDVVVTDIGTPISVFDHVTPDTFENDPKIWLSDLPRPQNGGNKYSRGHALISGGFPITGAARMAARAAARAGAGLTSIAVPEIAFPIYATSLNSIMVQSIADIADFRRLVDDRRFTAFLIGPGSGISGETRLRAQAAMESDRPTVLDADALSSFQDDPMKLFRAFGGNSVFTPHDGEFQRLFDPSGDKLTRVRAAARLSGSIIVLKGCDSVIASPDGRAIINSNAPPTLATGGSGDVLGGIILGLLAQGMDPFHAAAAAVWMHGAAASNFGPGLIAEDLPDLLPGVFRNLYCQEEK